MNKTLKQRCLNKVIDSCIEVLGNPNATKRQVDFATSLLNKAYQRSGVDIRIDSIEESLCQTTQPRK